VAVILLQWYLTAHHTDLNCNVSMVGKNNPRYIYTRGLWFAVQFIIQWFAAVGPSIWWGGQHWLACL